ncbi:MAG: hypothetical protein IPM54_28305 [Polyangiaceae bacterium]|nr:hypothetical protein [Polyangiaceae bacterium]
MIRGGQFAALFVAFLIFGCSDGGPTTSTSSSSSSSSSSSGQGGSGGEGGQGGAGGGGGAGGEAGQGGQGGQGGAMQSHGPGSQAFVNAGEVSKSPGYKLVWTMGQSTQNQSTMSSDGYRLQGGLIGATGSKP